VSHKDYNFVTILSGTHQISPSTKVNPLNPRFYLKRTISVTWEWKMGSHSPFGSTSDS